MKKIVIFKGGLGNQMFQYGMYTWLKYVRHQNVRYMYREADHNGFELDKWFDVNLQEASVFYKCLYWVVWRLNKYGMLKRGIWFGRGRDERPSDIFLNGYWTKREYFIHNGFDLTFKQLPLSAENQHIASLMKQTASIAVHVRRGDYLKPQNVKIFCEQTPDYYLQAIELCRSKLKGEVRVFFFSDDIAWVRDNIKVDQAEYIDWNHGQDSIYDMYLMSMAHACVISNSTFSFWAAMLNQRKDVVVYPKKWFVSGSQLDIFPEYWIRL